MSDARPRGALPRGAQHRQERTEALLDAALRALRRHGADCSIDQIAAEVGVTRPIIYRYFGSREGLSRAIAGHASATLKVSLDAAIAGSPAGRWTLLSAIDAWLAFIEAEPELYRYLTRGRRGGRPSSAHLHGHRRRAPRRTSIKGAATATTGSPRLGEFIEVLGRELAVIIGDQLRAAGRDSGAAEPWAYALIGMAGMAGEWWLERRTVSRRQLAEYLTHLAWDGMAADPAAAQATAPPLARRNP